MKQPSRTPTIAIVGGGASGSLAAVHTIRAWRGDPALRIVMYDVNGRPGRGLAFGTEDRCHLLNVPAGRMSALVDEPTHFVDWLQRRARDTTPWTFAPRADYGEYLSQTLLEHGNVDGLPLELYER